MKHIITLLSLLIISFKGYSQKESPQLPIDSLTGKIVYSDVIKVENVKAPELYSMGREWLAKAYKSSNSVIQMDDRESGKIIGKASLQVYHKALGANHPSGFINYTISLYFRDNRYKYEITDFHHVGQNKVPAYGVCEDMINTKDKTMGISHQKTYNYYLSQLDENIKLIISDLKATLSKTKKSENDNW